MKNERRISDNLVKRGVLYRIFGPQPRGVARKALIPYLITKGIAQFVATTQQVS
jgi:hypothetical protein